jgi:hypothetical protein
MLPATTIGYPIASILEFPILVQGTAMTHTMLLKARRPPLATGNVWKRTGIFNFGLMHFLIMAALLMVHYNRATRVLIVLTVLMVKVDFGWLYMGWYGLAWK